MVSFAILAATSSRSLTNEKHARSGMNAPGLSASSTSCSSGSTSPRGFRVIGRAPCSGQRILSRRRRSSSMRMWIYLSSFSSGTSPSPPRYKSGPASCERDLLRQRPSVFDERSGLKQVGNGPRGSFSQSWKERSAERRIGHGPHKVYRNPAAVDQPDLHSAVQPAHALDGRAASAPRACGGSNPPSS